MRNLRTQLPVAAVALVAALAVWAALATVRQLAGAFSLALYLLASLAFFVDLVDLLVRLAIHRRQMAAGGRRPTWRLLASPTSVPLREAHLTPRQKRLHVKPWALVVSVYDAEDEIDDFLDRMEPFLDRLWAVDDASTDATRLRLLDAGVRCLAGEVNRKKPGALRALLATLPPDVATVVVLDPDVRIRDGGDPRGELETVLFDFQATGMAAVSPRMAVREDGFLARFQGLEYAICCSFGRRTMGPDGTNSGVSIYRRDALATALAAHSLSVYAEDFENSLILLAAGEEIYYDERLVFETDAKRTWRGWLSQRVGWSYGFLKVYKERLGELRRIGRRRFMAAYHYLVYSGGVGLLLHPLRLAMAAVLAVSFANGCDELLGLGALPDNAFTQPGYFLAAYLKYAALVLLLLAVAVPRGERRWLLAAVPFYLFYQLAHVVAQSLGFANWISLRVAGRRVYRDHYQDEESLRRQLREA